MATPPKAPILGMYQTNGAFPTPGPSAWASGPTTNMSATYLAFDADWATYAAPFVSQCNANGLIPFVELEPWHWSQAAVPFADILSGVWDSYLTAIGSGVAASGKPVMLTFAHEFNVSGQYPWSQNANATIGSGKGSGPGGGDVTPANWIATWNYVRNKINSTAGGLALFMWACSAYTGGTTISPAPYWPGSSNVDMVGIDGYPNTKYGASLGTFAGQIQPTISVIRGLGWAGDIFLAETNLGSMVASGGESIASFVSDMHTAGVSGILEFEDASWGLPQMTAAQWNTYNNAVASLYGTGGGSSGGGSGSGGAGTGSLTVTKGTADEVHAASGVAHSTTAVNPPAGSMVHWEVSWLNSNDTLGLTFTAADSAGNSYGAPTRKGNPGDGDGGCYLLVWDHVYNAAPGPITLTVTASGSGVSGAAPSDCLILPYTVVGAATDQSAAAFAHFEEVGTSTTTYEISLTTTTPGAQVFVMAAPNHNGGATGPVSPIGNTTLDVDWDDAGVGSRGTFGRATSTVSTPGPTTYGFTSANPSPNGYGVMAFEIIPASPGSGGGTTGGSSSGALFTAVGSYIETSTTTFTWKPTKAGNTLAVICFSEESGKPVTAISSSNASWAQVVGDQTLGSTTVSEATAFLGTATSPTSAIVTLTTAAASGNLRVLAREVDSGGLPVALDVYAVMNGDSAGPVAAWPSVTPTKGGEELLFGFERNFNDTGTTAVAGSSANTTYYVDANGNGGAIDLSVSGATSVNWGDTDSRTAMVLLLWADTSGGSGSTGGGGTTGSGAATASFWYDAAALAGLNARAVLLNGGTLRVYSGAQPAVNAALTGTLLCTLGLSATAFQAATASGGKVTAAANPITPGVVTATGTPGYFALVTSLGQPLITGLIGDGTTVVRDLNIPASTVTAGQTISCSAFSLGESETGN